MAWNLLFTSDIGLLSLFTILFILVMAAYIYYYVKRQTEIEMKGGTVSNQVPHAH